MTTTKGKLKVLILGAGHLAARVASIVSHQGHQLRISSRNGKNAKALAKEFKAKASAPAEAAAWADFLFFAVPAGAIADVAHSVAEGTRGDQVAMQACRGVASGFQLANDVIRRSTCIKKVGVLGGPLYFEDFAVGRPLAAVLGSRYPGVPKLLAHLVSGAPIKLYPTTDCIGVQVAGAVSNVSALAVGMAEALSMGETARGILQTHGLEDATQIGMTLGARRETFAGLAGVGDLIPRRVFSTEKHHAVGEAIVQGKSLKDALLGVVGEVEGITTVQEAMGLAKEYDLQLPLISAVSEILKGNDAKAELEKVLRQDFTL